MEPNADWLSQSSVDGLWFLADLAIKSALLLLAAGAGAMLLRGAPAAARHRLLSAALCGLVALPLLALVLPSWRVPLIPAGHDAPVATERSDAPVAPSSPAQMAASARGVSHVATFQGESRVSTFQVEPHIALRSESHIALRSESHVAAQSESQILEAATIREAGSLGGWKRIGQRVVEWPLVALVIWLAGAIAVAGRLLIGIWRVWWLARRAHPMSDSSWLGLERCLAERLGLRRRVRLLSSERVVLPMTWGALRPVVLLPAEAGDWSESCRSAVLLHELAHVKRRDCLTQTLAQVACALYWFNPLVWLSARRLRVERELACDEQVLAAGTRASDYAGHLLEIATSVGGVAVVARAAISEAAVGMGGSELERRVEAILDPGRIGRAASGGSAWRLNLGAACLIVPIAAIHPWAEARSPMPEEVAVTEQAGLLSRDALESELRVAGATHESAARETVADAGSEVAAGIGATAPDAHPAEARADRPTNELLDERADERADEQADERGNERGNERADEADGRAVEAGGEAVAAQSERQEKGRSAEFSADEMAAMRMQGVTPEFIESMRRLGYDGLTAGQLISLKTHGVSEQFISEMRTWAGRDLSLNELLQAKIHNLTPAYARQMQSLGAGDLSFDKLIGMRIHGVSEEFVREMRAMGGPGFDSLTVEDALRMRIHGINSAYVRRMRDAGFKNVSVTEMIEMRMHGIDRILLKGAR